LEFGGGVGWGTGIGSGQARSDGWEEEGRLFRLRLSPLRGRDCAATFAAAATGIAECGRFRLQGERILAVMNSLAEAADTRRVRHSRERYWEKISREREEQQ
jgi:hypothetical protein